MIRPSVVHFLDVMLRDKDRNLRVEEVTIQANFSGVNQSIESPGIRTKTGLLVLAIQKPGAKSFVYNPAGTEKLVEGTAMIVVGEVPQIKKLRLLMG